MAALRSSDAVASIKTHRSCGLGSTWSPSNARAQRRTVDRVSDIGRLRFNRAFGDRGATRRHTKVFRSRSDGRFLRDHGIVAHDHRAIMAVDRSSPNWTVRDFCVDFFYKTVFFLFCKSTLDWIVKRLSNFGAKSWVLRDPPVSETQFWSDWGRINHKSLRDLIDFSPWTPNVRQRESDQIHFNRSDLEPNLHVDRVSSVNRSFILQKLLFRLNLCS